MTLLRRFRLEDIAAVLILSFFGIAGAIPGIAPNQANEMTGAAASRLQTVAGIGSQLFVNILIAMLLFAGWRLFSRYRGVLRWSSVLAIWAVSSILWSQDPLLTGRRALPFVFATAFGMFLALRYPQDRLLNLLQITFAVLASWSAVLAVGFPAIGLDASTGHGGDWQGVFTQKNACGRAMVFAIAAVMARRHFSFSSAACFLLFAGELMMSGSRGAWLLGAATVAALLVFRFSCRFDRASRSFFLAMLACLAVTACAIAVLDFGNLAPLLGRDATLTGRTAIWHEVWLSILHRPALGYGFSAFWRGAQGASWSVVVALHFVLFHAHNGFLEVWLELGAAGLLLLAAGYVRAAVLLWPELRAGRYREAAWPGVVLLLIALYDIDENTLLSFNGLFWVLYTGALTRIELLAVDRSTVRRHMRAEKRNSLVPGPWIGLKTAAGRLSSEEQYDACSSVQARASLLHKPPSDRNIQVVKPWL